MMNKEVYTFIVENDQHVSTDVMHFSNKEALSAYLLEFVVTELRNSLDYYNLEPSEWKYGGEERYSLYKKIVWKYGGEERYSLYKKIVSGELTDGFEAYATFQTEGYEQQDVYTSWDVYTIIDEYKFSPAALADTFKPPTLEDTPA